jgi:pre-rRNA-processing protein TSR2
MSAMLTRKNALETERASRHPEAEKYFKEGLGSIFRQWTALELAVFHQWGGASSSERADSLVIEILEMFNGNERIYKDDISLVLEDFLETNFETICEDDSPDELGELLVQMYRECGLGNFTLVTNTLSREFQRHSVVSRSQGIEQGGDAIDSDEDGEMTNEGNNSNMGVIVEEEEEEEVPPRVDADGWENVVSGKKKKGGKKK